MTDTMETNDTSAEYEALRSAQYEEDGQDAGTETMQAADEPAEVQEGEEQTDPTEQRVETDLEKLQKSVKERSGAARRERQGRLAAEQRAQELEARLAALEAKSSDDPLAQLREDDADPIGDLEAIKRYFRANQQTQAQQQAQQQEQANRQREIQTLTNYAAPFEEDFKAENPDYDQAAQHLAQGRMEDLLAMYAGDANRAQQHFNQELLTLIANAKAQNADPAAIVYDLAKKRGFNSKVAIDNASNKLQTIQRGQQASRSLSGGKAESGEITVEAINRMPSNQRAAAFEKLREQERRREAMG
jgi:hypothetical protein